MISNNFRDKEDKSKTKGGSKVSDLTCWNGAVKSKVIENILTKISKTT